MPKRSISDVDTNIGHNLAYYRKLAGLTQQEIAERLNMNRTTYTKYETGASEPGIEILKQIADILEVEVSMLLFDVPENTSVSDVIGGYDEDITLIRYVYQQLTELSIDEWRRVAELIAQMKEEPKEDDP